VFASGADAILIPEVPVDFDLLYSHVMSAFMRRVETSDAHKGTASVIVAEGLRDSSGKELVDESSEADAFGHKRLMGAGKYVVKQLEERVKKDAAVKEFMKRTGQFVEGVYEIPEIREVRPGHLVRCGFATPVDANFGLEAGAAAVELHVQGINGVTVVAYKEGRIQYMDVADAIQQRHVDPDSISLYEQMGICFGRKVQAATPRIEKLVGKPDRVY
jgi:6-phosphofructokinase 1